MRHFLSILSGLLLGLSGARSQSLNIATWMVELPDANPTNRAAEFEPVLKRVAGVLKPLNADIVLLHGLSDRPAAKQLTDLLRPRVYHNSIQSKFREPPNGLLVEPSLTVLSKKQPSWWRTIEWRANGQSESPGGFSIAVFPYGSNVLFLYTAQFPKAVAGLTPQQQAAIPRKRELSARYLISHLTWLMETSTNAAKFAYLATDIELDAATATNDPALAVLTANGFKPCSGNRTLVASAALSSTGWPPDGALTSAFIRGAEFPGDPESIERKNFFAPVALVEVDLKATPPPLVVASSPSTNEFVTQVTAKAHPESLVPWADNRTLALAVGGALVLLAVATAMARSRRRPLGRASVAVGPANLAGRLPAPDRENGGVPFQVLDGSGGRPDDGHDGHGGHGGHGPSTRGSQWPFLHLVRERLVRWLAAERSQLLSSHHAGAEQVLELEERLMKIQNQFEARLRAREQRIIELEAELMAKEKIVADLEHALATQLQRKSSPLPS